MSHKQTVIIFSDQIARPWPKLRLRLWLVNLLACVLYPVWLWLQAWPHIDRFLTNLEDSYMQIDARIADTIRQLADWLAGPTPASVGAL